MYPPSLYKWIQKKQTRIRKNTKSSRLSVKRNRLRIFEIMEKRWLLTSFYFSTASSADLPGISEIVQDEDIVSYNGNEFQMLFDGSDVGLSSLDVSAFSILDDNSILISFRSRASIGALGNVDDSDIVKFIPASLGGETKGTFELYFDGSDVGLSTGSEDIDGLAALNDGTILISTKGNFHVSDVSGFAEDLLAFSPTQLGPATSGSWTLRFDGSDVGLSEDVDAVAVGVDGKYYLSASNVFSVDSANGNDEDVFVLTPTTLGANTAGSFEMFVDGSQISLAREDINALHIPSGSSLNRAPMAGNDSYATDEDNVLVVNASGVLKNDTDGDGDALAALLVSGPSNGTLTLSTDGSFSYTPDSNFNGSDSFAYRADDGTLGSSTATVSLSVTSVNDPPVASSQVVTTHEDTSAAIILNGSDIDGDLLSYSVVSGPENGSLSGTAPNLTYTPVANYYGSDSFTFKVHDGTLDSPAATVSISVTAVNDPPSISDIEDQAVAEDAATNAISFTIGDLETPADSLSLSGSSSNTALVADPGIVFGGSGVSRTVTVTPAANQFGTTTISVTAGDGSATSVDSFLLTVSPVNDAPSANDQSTTIAEDTAQSITLTGSDLDGNAITYSMVRGPASGTLRGTIPNLTYTPAANYYGSDSFAFKVHDGTLDSPAATVSISVTSVNDPPVASSKVVTTHEDTSAAITLNGSDIDGDLLSYSVVSGPENGSLSGTAPNLTYTPAANYYGSDSFTFKVHDGTLDSPAATVSISVTPVNDPPVASNQLVTTGEGTSVAITLSGSDVDGDSLTYSVVRGTSNGSFLFGAGPNLTYTPPVNYFGLDSFIFKVNDGALDSVLASVSITVLDVPDTKFFVPDASADEMFEYEANGTLVTNSDLASGNNAPRGAASTVSGDTVWVVDKDDLVYVYDDAGNLQGSWKANGLDRPEGIATEGSDIWIVDRGTEQVYFFNAAASSIPSGRRDATSSFALASGNESPRGITTDGVFLWVVNSGGSTDSVFKYEVDGTFMGSWVIDSSNSNPRGITIDPSGVSNSIWIVDHNATSVFEYSNGKSTTGGILTESFSLTTGNSDPQGIADPPPQLSASPAQRNTILTQLIDDEYFAAAPWELIQPTANETPKIGETKAEHVPNDGANHERRWCMFSSVLQLKHDTNQWLAFVEEQAIAVDRALVDLLDVDLLANHVDDKREQGG